MSILRIDRFAGRVRALGVPLVRQRRFILVIAELDLLRARCRLSLARMYLVDLETGADFGRMVDARGTAFNCSRAIWIGFILKIANETMLLLPEATNAVLIRMCTVCPEVAQKSTDGLWALKRLEAPVSL